MESEARPRILIVDDAPENLRLLMDVLGDQHVILAARTGEKALRLARTEPRPDVILLDIMMPEMDGYAVCAELKADPSTRDIPVLFITALSEMKDEIRGLSLGAADYLTKPLRPAIVRARVRTQIERRRAEAEVHQLRKTESLGRMAGALAHHCNNLLMVVIGNMEMAMMSLADEDVSEAGERESTNPSVKTLLNDAMEAARRASKIGGQMLTYLGHSATRRIPVDFCEILRPLLENWRAEAPPEVVLRGGLEGPETRVEANPEQIRWAVNALVANAREATGEADGAISLALDAMPSTKIPAAGRFPPDFQPAKGTYIRLTVTDTGEGISSENVEKIFDPFFSTRFVGRGLGLPGALGVVKEHGGCMVAQSRPGRGASFQLFLPEARRRTASPPDASDPAPEAARDGDVEGGAEPAAGDGWPRSGSPLRG